MDYNEYVRIQTKTALSHEENNEKWAEGQRIFIRKISHQLKAGDLILDCACGDGIGLEELRRLGYNPVGVDLAEAKIDRAKQKKLDARYADMHDLSIFEDDSFNVVICSHTLEHALDPAKVIKNFRRILKNDGLLFIVLPFPDPGDDNTDVHVSKDILGTSNAQNGETKIKNFFEQCGFEIIEKSFDAYREPEIWLTLKMMQAVHDE